MCVCVCVCVPFTYTDRPLCVSYLIKTGSTEKIILSSLSGIKMG